MIIRDTAHADGRESLPANRPVRSKVSKGTVAAHDQLLAARIERLEAEERAAVLCRDWATATSKVLEKASLRKFRYLTTARRGA